DVSLTISHQKVPVLPHTYELAEDNIFPGGTIENVNWLADKVNFHESVTTSYQRILCDAITSGGLLISLPEEKATQYVQSFNKFSPIKAEIIGEVKSKREKFIHVI
ncbi:MAG TPA: selenide, water dikinase SelD, partial [Bacillota bacterium]|nr:selenide, water dikinase SelD [Bacillota bacterium]